MYSSGSPRSGLVRSSTWSPKCSSSSRVRRLEPGATSGAGTYRHRPGGQQGAGAGQRPRRGARGGRQRRAEGVELRGQRAVFGDGRVGVVTRDGGLEDAVGVVGTGPQAEVGAAVRRIEADRPAVRDDLRQGLGGACVVPLAPVVEPPVPELRAHERLPVPARTQQRGRLVGAGTEGGGGEDAGQRPSVEHQLGGAVRGVEQLGAATSDERVAHPFHGGAVVAVAPVLVLHLDGDDGAAAGCLERGDPGEEGVERSPHASRRPGRRWCRSNCGWEWSRRGGPRRRTFR